MEFFQQQYWHKSKAATLKTKLIIGCIKIVIIRFNSRCLKLVENKEMGR